MNGCWLNVPQQGFMSDKKIYFPTMWCKEPFCMLTWEEEETFEDLQKRYPDAFENRFGNINQVLNLKEGIYDVYTPEIYEINPDDNGKAYYLISAGALDLHDAIDCLKYCICIPLNWFALRKFYIEYFVPLKDFVDHD